MIASVTLQDEGKFAFAHNLCDVLQLPVAYNLTAELHLTQ